MNTPFTLAVCAEMQFTELPIIERIEKIRELRGSGRTLELDRP